MKIIRRILLVLLLIIAICICAIGISAWKHQRGFIDNIRYYLEYISGFLTAGNADSPSDKGISVPGKYYNIHENAEAVFIPDWDGKELYALINENVPCFSEKDKNYESSFIKYSELDKLGRTGPAFGILGKDIMPDVERNDYDQRLAITPSGYMQQKYPDLIEYEYLYNRCHLIAWQLGGDTIKENIFTGTRSLNTEGMLPFENQVSHHLRLHPYDHVIYRVTPVYENLDLTCFGVLIEALSIQYPSGLSFSVFVYNEQPGININHFDGSAALAE